MKILSFIRRNGAREEGQSLAVIVLGMATLLGLVALAVDAGNVLVARQRQQQAADAAVLAAIAIVHDGGTNAQAVAEARNYATKNGFTDSSLVTAGLADGATSVHVNIPPTQGSLAGDPESIEVIITRRIRPIFAGAVGAGPWEIQARAVSRLIATPAGFGVITLHPTNCQSLDVGSGSAITVTNGGIYVNSSCKVDKGALSIGSNNTLTADIISVTGDYTIGSGSVTNPTPKTRQRPVPDPWENVPVPSASGLVDRTPSDCRIRSDRTFQPGLYRCAPLQIDTNNVTFAPGTYVFRGGLQLTGQVRATFGRGIYIMQGGGFNMTSNTRATNTDGMLIYNGCYNGCDGDDWFQMESSAELIAKPYGAPYENLLVFQDRANTHQVDFNSHSVVNVGGVGTGIYAKNATIEYDCGSTIPLQFVALNVHIGSNARIVTNAQGLPPVLIKSFKLVE